MVSSRHYRFGAFELQPDERRLLAEGAAVRIGGHAFDVLHVLVERSGHLVTKDELLERVWPTLVVEENTLQAHVSALRRILGPDAIATISGRGYRFTPEVTHVEAATTRPSVAPRHNLPQQLTTFVGREKEIAELTHLLETTRLLTLTGAGGCGKTRLALQAAADRLRAYPDGVWLVELAPIAEPSVVPRTLANVLGIKEQPGKRLTETIVDAVASRHLLLVLDNAEHVLGACAELVDRALRGCAHLVILVTSRERLGIAGETTYRVPSLSVPDLTPAVTPGQVSASESGQLFIERARLQRPEFAITVDNAAAMASICRGLDGIPFAIELAAARVRAMSVEEVSHRLDQRFSLLTGGSRTALPRHRTLRSLIDWSYDLLSSAERGLLRQTSVFAGGWTLQAAEHVVVLDDVEATQLLDLHASLADKSLIWAEVRDDATRYGFQETVRHYARDQLRDSGEEAETMRRHLCYFLALAEEAEPRLTGGEQQAWFERLELESDNLRSALAAAVATGGDAGRGLRLAGALSKFWHVRGYLSEGRGWLSKVLAAPGAQAETDRAKALSGAGTLALAQGDGPAAEALFGEALLIQRRLGDRRGTADLLNGLGLLAQQRADYAGAKALHEESLAIGRELWYLSGMAVALNNLGNVAGELGDYVTSCAMHEESLALFRELGDRSRVATSLSNLGTGAYMRGDFQAAQALYEESLTIRRELGDRKIGYALTTLGSVASARGDYAAARVFHRESLAVHRELGDRIGMAWSLEGVAFTLALELPSHAARIWGGAERLREDLGAPLPLRTRQEHDGRIAAARAALGNDAEFDLAWREGRTMTLEQAVRFALDTE